jgi:predicted dehydrogenase
MADKPLGVGIIGVQPERSWAAVAHIPALNSLNGLEITALSTTRLESARAAANALQIGRYYDNHLEMVADPNVDIVVITVKVPYHLELVTAAIAAGKHIYCEWPLGNGLAEAEHMASLARSADIRCMVGLQARFSPQIMHVRQLIEQGYVGRVLSTTLIGSGMAWGSTVDEANAYIMDQKNGATMLTIPMAHALDAVTFCLGEIFDVAAHISIQSPDFQNLENGEMGVKTSPDQVAFTGTLETHSTILCHYRAGISRGTNLLWEINGTEGDIQVTSLGGHLQIFELSVSGSRGYAQALLPLELPDGLRTAPQTVTGPAVNVAQAWQAFEKDIRTGSRNCPDFEHGVRRHRMIDVIERSAALKKGHNK